MRIPVKANRPAPRRGIIVPLSAVVAVVLLAMVAFAVDIGWVSVTKSELQNAADASALAGVHPLMAGYVEYNLPNQLLKSTVLTSTLTAARAKAKQYAQHNAAGGVTSLVLNDSDIEFGFLDASGTYTPQPTFTGFPNTIKVTLRRDSQANGALTLFFARALGTQTTNVVATAMATIYAGVIDSLSQSKLNAGMLPMTYDVNHWNDFLKTGLDPDGLLSLGAGGLPQLKIYPSVKFKGNFGQLSLDGGHTGASTTTGWINSGMTKDDIASLVGLGLIPLAQHDASKWDWIGNPGMKASTIMTVNDKVGQTFLLPLYKPKDSSLKKYEAGVGQGSDYYYNIVQFVGIKIMPTDDTDKEIIIQPAAVIEPNAVFDPSTLAPAGTSTTLITTFTTPRLTR